MRAIKLYVHTWQNKESFGLPVLQVRYNMLSFLSVWAVFFPFLIFLFFGPTIDISQHLTSSP